MSGRQDGALERPRVLIGLRVDFVLSVEQATGSNEPLEVLERRGSRRVVGGRHVIEHRDQLGVALSARRRLAGSGP